MVYRYQFEAFSAPCDLHIDAPTESAANDAAKAVFENAKRLEYRYSFFRNDSMLYALNARTEDRCSVDDEFAGLLRLALLYADVTKGVFDIAAAGTLKELSAASSLDEYRLLRDTLLPFASISALSLYGNEVCFSNRVTKIDFGGLVKEYAVDQGIFILQSMGVDSAMVNFGGDLAVIGTYPDHPWRIGIQNPLFPQENLMEADIKDVSVCTSGHSKRFTMIQSEKISHIISQKEGKRSYSQVSIKAPTTVDAGVWSTALLIKSDLELPNHISLLHACT